jgi:putative ABC transport system substrate-binding protein
LQALVGAALFARPLSGLAQSPTKVARIGYLGDGFASDSARLVEAFRAGLRDFGYVEGKNFVIEFRWTEGKNERFLELATELVRLKVDVIVTPGTPGTLAAKRATTTIPIVTPVVGDAVDSGIVASLARPGGNVTGTTILSPELMAKRLELLMETLPRSRQVAVLINPDNPVQALSWQAMENSAKKMKVGVQKFEARRPNEFEGAFSAMARQRVDAVVISQDGVYIFNAKALADVAAKKGLPSIAFSEFAEVGGLIGYGVDLLEVWRRAAYFVDRILMGAKAGDIPVERPTTFRLVINLQAAKALGVQIPAAMLFRADRLIE